MSTIPTILSRARSRAAAIPLAAAAVCALVACNPDTVEGPRLTPDAAAPATPAVAFTASADDAARLATAVADAAGRLLQSADGDAGAADAVARALHALQGAVERGDGAAVQGTAATVRRALARLGAAGGPAAADLDAIGLALDRVSAAVRVYPDAAR